MVGNKLGVGQVEQYRRDGYVKGACVLDSAEVEELRSEMARVIRDQGRADVPQPVRLKNLSRDPGSPVWQIVNIWQASRAFARLLHHAAIVEAAAELLQAREVRLWHDQVQYKPAGTGGVNMWHQDSPYWRPLEPKDQQVTAWIALDDVDADNGCMSMVPGSHLWGNHIEYLNKLKSFDAMPREYFGHAVEVRLCPVAKGQVHFHHSLTWHGSHANTSGRPRRAIALHFMSEKTVHNANEHHVMTPFIKVADGQLLTGEAFPVVWTTVQVAATTRPD
jgi:ectoine hydroxylase-related dioxygenase (phytanoyl-CoA dioxygenase family)